MIVVTNKSTVVSNTDVSLMSRACAHQVRYDAAPAWGLQPIPVVYMSDESHAPPGSWVIAVMDDPDQAGVLGWHTEDQGDVIYGRVFVKPVLDNGGDALTKPLSVASVLSHEVVEVLCDPHVSWQSDDGLGRSYALEACDPVESDSYVIPITPRGATEPVGVTVSNFVLPEWFDPQGVGPFDHLRKLTKPFTMTSGGYVVVTAEGKTTQRFGEEYPAWRKAGKLADTSRTARRLGRKS